MKKTIIFYLTFLSILCVSCTNEKNINSEKGKEELEIIESNFILDIPEELYGKYKVTEEIWICAVGRINSPSPLNDTFELQKNYIIYNGERYPNPRVWLHECNLSSADLWDWRYVSNDLELDEGDTVNLYFISKNGDELLDLGLFYTSNGDLFVDGHGDLGGKAEKIE